VRDFLFEEANVEVPVGTSVTLRHEGLAPHTVSSVDGLFSSGPLTGGDTFTFAFTEPGVYAYFCEVHPRMEGTIWVVDGMTAEDGGIAPTDDGPTPESTTVAETPADRPTQVPTSVPTPQSTRTPEPTIAAAEPPASLDQPAGGEAPPATASPRPTVAVSTQLATAVVTATPTTTTTPTVTPTPTLTMMPTMGPPNALITISDNFFGPSTAYVRPGGTVTWTNRGQQPHTVSTITGPGPGPSSPGALNRDASYTWTATATGTYSYRCTFHDAMQATIIVG
jgi:plastocyanin